MAARRAGALRWLAYLALSLPLAVLLWGFAQHQLGANPIREATLRMGKMALVLLVLTLVATPAYQLLGWRALVWLRRALGLFVCFYAGAHLGVIVGLDYRFDLALLQLDVLDKRYALLGLASFLLLLPLALTSTAGWQQRLGWRWTALHRLIYLAALLDVGHYLWLVKADTREPLMYGAIVVLLLILRLPILRQALGARRSRPTGAR